MDQIASAAGNEGHAILIDCVEPVAVRPVRVPTDASFLVITTRVKHALGSTEYPLRAAATAHAAHVLGAQWLCSLTEADVLARVGVFAHGNEWRFAVRHWQRFLRQVLHDVATWRRSRCGSCVGSARSECFGARVREGAELVPAVELVAEHAERGCAGGERGADAGA